MTCNSEPEYEQELPDMLLRSRDVIPDESAEDSFAVFDKYVRRSGRPEPTGWLEYIDARKDTSRALVALVGGGTARDGFESMSALDDILAATVLMAWQDAVRRTARLLNLCPNMLWVAVDSTCDNNYSVNFSTLPDELRDLLSEPRLPEVAEQLVAAVLQEAVAKALKDQSAPGAAPARTPGM